MASDIKWGEQLQLESLEERRKVQRLAFMYKILNGQVAVPAASVDLILSSRPSRGTNANQQKLITVRSHTENYTQSYSIRTVKDWNSLPQSIVSAGSLALFKSRLTRHAAPWLHSPSVWCPCQGPCRLLIQIQIQMSRTVHLQQLRDLPSMFLLCCLWLITLRYCRLYICVRVYLGV